MSPFAARQFAYGDTVAKRQLQAVENAAKALGILPKIDTHIVDIAKKLKFGR